MRNVLGFLFFLSLLATFSSCSTHCLDDQEIADYIHTRIGKKVTWGDECATYITQAIEEDLEVDHAVQIALLNNPEIQAEFENLGIAHADLIQAGLFSNPIFDLLIRFPNKSDFKINIDYSVVFQFLDVFRIPLRKKVAQAEFEKVQLEVTHAILDLSFEVEQTYYALVAEKMRLTLLQEIAEIIEAAYEVALAQANVGNIYLITLEKYHTDSLSALMEQKMAEIEIVSLRNKLNRLLGFEDTDLNWDVPDLLLTPSDEDLSLDALKELALCERLDLQALEWEVEKVARMGSLKKWWNYTDVMIGVSGEREPEGEWVTGPAIGGSIPIFDYGQAQRARLCSLLRQNIDQYQSLRIAILSEIAQTYESMQTLRDMATSYREEILPAQEEIIDSSQKLYNVMSIDTFTLIENKKQQYLAEIHYLAALRDYWIMRVKLKRSIGGRL